MPGEKDIAAVFASITDRDEMARFLEEIFSKKEREDLALRWELLCDLHLGETQRTIAAKHKISLCKITRGSKILKQTESVTKKALETMYGRDDEQEAK